MGRDAGTTPATDAPAVNAGEASKEATLNYTMAFEADDDDEEEVDAADENAPPPVMAILPTTKEETAAAASGEIKTEEEEMADVQLAMRRQLAGLPPKAEPLQPLSLLPPAPPPEAASTPRNAPGGGGSAAAMKPMAGEIDLSASVALIKQAPPKKRSSDKPSSARAKPNLLANSLDTYASQRGVTWKPDRKDIYTSVAFVLQQHIATGGDHLLVRSEPPPDPTLLSDAPTQQASPLGADPCASPDQNASSTTPQSRGTPSSAGHAGRPSPQDASSPDLPAAVRRSFIAGSNSVHGLRYSLEMSPIVEQKRHGEKPPVMQHPSREERHAAAAGKRALAAPGHTGPIGGGAVGREMRAAAAAALAAAEDGDEEAVGSPMRGKASRRFGVPIGGAGEEQWADASWAQDSEEDDDDDDEEEMVTPYAVRNYKNGVAVDSEDEGEDEAMERTWRRPPKPSLEGEGEEEVDLNDTAVWEDAGWKPHVEDFSLFDERLHPLRPGLSTASAAPDPTKELPIPDVNTVSNYIRSLTQSARMGAEASVVALSYIERIVSMQSGQFSLDGNTWRRATLTALLLASKVWDDDCLENREFAQHFGHDVVDLNALEGRFVSAINFKLACSPSEYARYYFALRTITQSTEQAFNLRPLDGELEEKLARMKDQASGAALGRWSDWLQEVPDLSRSV